MKRELVIGGLVLLGVAALVAWLTLRPEPEERRNFMPANQPIGPPTPPPKPEPPTRRHISAEGTRERRLEDAAITAVFARCSTSVVWAWKTARAMEAIHVPPMGDRLFELVNVGAKLEHAATKGHTLWYEVRFTGEAPSEIVPSKDISGELCRLGRAGAALD